MIRQSVIFDVGRVLFDWDLRHLFAKLIADEAELEWFVTHVVTPQWHFQHDAGRPLTDMLPELKAEFPDHAALIDAYAARFNETIPAPMPGSLEQKIELFRETGRVFRKNEELFVENSWVQVMIGQGIVPQGYHPLVDQLAPAELKAFMQHVQRVIADCVEAMPAHEAFIARYCQAPPAGAPMAA